jgi:hypothetical protein
MERPAAALKMSARPVSAVSRSNWGHYRRESPDRLLSVFARRNPQWGHWAAAVISLILLHVSP